MNSTIKRRLMDLIKDRTANGRNDEKFCSTWNYWAEKYEIVICEKYDEKAEEDKYLILRATDLNIELDDNEALATLNAILKDETHIPRTKQTNGSKEQIRSFSTIQNGIDKKKVNEIEKAYEFKLSNQERVNLGNQAISELSPLIEEIGGDMQRMIWQIAYHEAKLKFVLESAYKIGLAKNREKLKKLSDEHLEATTRSGKTIRKAKAKSESTTKKKSNNKPVVIVSEFNKDLSKKQLEAMEMMNMNPNIESDVTRFKTVFNQ